MIEKLTYVPQFEAVDPSMMNEANAYKPEWEMRFSDGMASQKLIITGTQQRSYMKLMKGFAMTGGVEVLYYLHYSKR